MDNLYRDYVEGCYIPDIEITRRPDNGHYTARSCGIEVTHYDQAQAVTELQSKLQDGILRGEIHPGQ